MSNVLSAAIAAALVATADWGSLAEAAIHAHGVAEGPGVVAAAGQVLAQRTSTPCVNGYRTTHIVRGGGRTGPGVLIRCRG
jgi:hypothetical protein